MASLFSVIGYPDSLDLSSYADKNSLQMLFLVPRVLMGILAVVDTFLIYKIGELRYNRNVAFVASVLFAIMPITWLTRWILLDTLQIPFLLLSILFALGCRSASLGENYDKVNSNNNNILKILLSGIFLGLAIFTKATLFTMIPLVGFLVLMHCRSTSRLEVIGLWLHLMPLVIGFCLAAGRLITEISYKISHKKFQQSLFAITFAIGAIGIVNTAVLITSNDNSHYFDAAAFVNKYLEKNKDNGGNTTDTITVISTPFYLWLPLSSSIILGICVKCNIYVTDKG